jgi:hypothetical protein
MIANIRAIRAGEKDVLCPLHCHVWAGLDAMKFAKDLLLSSKT